MARTNFTYTIWIIFSFLDKFLLHHLDHFPLLRQNSPSPFGSFSLVRTKFTHTILDHFPWFGQISPTPFGSFALVRTNFTYTIWIICPGSDKFNFHHLNHLPWFGQISPAPLGSLVIVLTSSHAPIGSFAQVQTNFTRTFWIFCPGSDKFHLHHLDHLPWFGQISLAPLGSLVIVLTSSPAPIGVT